MVTMQALIMDTASTSGEVSGTVLWPTKHSGLHAELQVWLRALVAAQSRRGNGSSSHHFFKIKNILYINLKVHLKM